ncbi:MAG: hypothetical protein RIS48_175 [Pseudomonadota bacterium]
MVWLTQLLFYGLPWLSWNDRQAVLFDLDARRFYLFKLALYPQDFIYLALLLVICALGLFFVTAVAGRVWCGFSCPQTVYTAIYLWVERRFEGDRSARMRLDAAPWTLHLDTGPWETFWIGFYGLATYGNAGYLREQVCKHMCPYGRFQSVMFDRDTLIIGYDSARGEPRGSRSRASDAQAGGLGDCINCTMCVQVCPTGIDIRDGLQIDCIGCAACIDACDEVMDKIGSPRGLIRYSSQTGLEQGWGRDRVLQRALRPRVLVYGALLLAISTAFVTGLLQRSPFRVDVMRDRGVLARMVEQGAIENAYRLQIMNSQESVQRYRIGVTGLQGLTLAAAPSIELGPMEERTVTATVRLAGQQAAPLAGQALPIHFAVEQLSGDQAGHQVLEKSSFLVPR